MDQLAIARKALQDEITALRAEVSRLEGVLATIDPKPVSLRELIAEGRTHGSDALGERPRRGRPPKAR